MGIMSQPVRRATPTDLPDLLCFADGRRVAMPAEWLARRAELLELLQELQYGHLPPARPVAACQLSSGGFGSQPDFAVTQHRLTMGEQGLGILVTVYRPAVAGTFPVVIDGDGCWRGLTDEIILAVGQRGYALAVFNRLELAPDYAASGRTGGLYTAFPDGDFGALAAWAWGYHRVVDFLQTYPGVDAARIAVTGHSRGGKTALLAGATEERIAVTAPNDSGCCGAGCTRFPDEGGERLADITRGFPHWFSPRLNGFVGKEFDLPFDQHALKAAVAPRALLSTEARGDTWASPRGTRLTHEAAREIYRALGVESRIGIWYRDGGHAHTLGDWRALLDFCDLQFYGKPAPQGFDAHP
jgi:dienelactone hydrolase